MTRLATIMLLLCACAYAKTPRALSNVQVGYKPMSVAAQQPRLVTIRVQQPVYQPNVDIGLIATTDLLSTNWQEINRTLLVSNALYYEAVITNNGTQQFFRSFTDYSKG